MKKYVIGVDFGTLSARAIVLDVKNKAIVGEQTSEYEHKVIENSLPEGQDLPKGFALQDPNDYVSALSKSVKGAINAAHVSPDDIGGIGIDFTASTILPIFQDGTPLCNHERFKNNPHSYVKLWKHHGAQKEADEFTLIANERKEKWIGAYGGIVSAELMFPKVLETTRNAPDVYDAAYRFIEAGDWINMLLTDNETHAAAFAGFKAFWNCENGFPSNDYFESVDKRLDGIIGTKISNSISSVSESAGTLSQRGASLTGLNIGTPVSLAMLDAHAAMPALNVTDVGKMMIILGTSACHIMNSDSIRDIAGIFGRVKNGVVPDVVTYEAGQQCFGDAFDWFVTEAVPQKYYEEANQKGVSIHELLTKKAEKLHIAQSGLVALDWFNGNRSVLVNSRLSGMILGLTLSTKSEEIYRALLEAAAFGTKRIIDQFESSGIEIHSVVAAGGIANKNSLLMQIIADVLNKKVSVSPVSQTAAFGSAIYASVAAGFFNDIKTASAELSLPCSTVYEPIAKNVVKYADLYKEYLTLHDYFGKDNMIMERLYNSKNEM